MSDSKELSVLRAASRRLIDSDDETIEKFCHSAADVSAFEDALQQCSTEHFRAESAVLSLSAAPDQETVHKAMKTLLWHLLTNVLTRNDLVYEYEVDDFSWSLEGYSMVARIAKSILSSWCIDKNWIDDENAREHTVLMLAASMGHISVVELLLAVPRMDKASIDHADNFGRTALMQAASSGHVSIVELLLADPRVDKASINHADIYGDTALMLAAIDGHTSIIELLLADSRMEKSCIDHTDYYGSTALMHAVEDGYTAIVERFLADPRVDKASIDHADKRGETALICTAKCSHTSIMELFLADPRVDKASIDHVNNSGWTALMCAAMSGSASIVELLLADPRVDKAYIDHANTSGYAALCLAADYCNWRAVKLLISDTRTSWDSIVELTHDFDIMQRDGILSLIIAALTRRQMCVIYPSTNRLLWPLHAQPDAKSDDTKSSGPAASDNDAREDGIEELECALIASFFKSDLFDVNVLRIIREYATYTV
jgi:ankyrin repeat protein